MNKRKENKMRAKKAKALRKIAREQTLGAPEVEYVASKNHPGTWFLARNCTRSFYKRIKKAYMLQKKLNH